MMNKKNMVIVVLATLCLTVTLFSIIPVMSAPAYDAWLDVNESGSIDVKDYQIIKNAIPSVGDPTKNVVVTNWPVKRTLNASLAYMWIIDGSQAWQLEADVTGYSKVTLVLKVEMAGVLDAAVYFIIGGVWTTPVYRNYTLTSGTYFLLQNYEVIGPTILIEFSPSGTVMVSVGLYATE